MEQKDTKALQAEIRQMCKEKNAVVLAHYYTTGDIQECADFVGDSLALARKAANIANGSEEEQNLVVNKDDGSALTGNAEIARLAAASGTAKKVVATDAIGTTGGTKGVSPDVMSNLEVCQKRAPEELSYSCSKENFSGEITIPAKSFVVVKIGC